MGSVYLAEHPTIGKKVALKVLHAEFASNPEVAERFFTEAKAVNAIGHPNIVDIVDYGVIQAIGGRDRMVYFIMEFLAGTTLSQVIRAEAPIPPERALTIAMQVADALAASHRSGIVHRDLKPDNIILIQRGRERDFVKLLDFGIAKLTGGDGLSSHRTRTGLVLGTPAYMSPEQCEGKPNVDHRTDIYALGIVLYEMLVGRVPFIGEGYGDILVQHLTQKPIEPSRYRMMSPHVEQVVMKALEKRPELRYPTMDEFMRAMSDPVGYVEANGGITGFAQRQLTPSSAPLPPVGRMTPAPMGAMSAHMPTPMPGMLSPVPGSLSPVPTTLGAAAGQVAGGGRSKAGFVIGGVLVVAAAAAGVFFVLNGKSKTPADNGNGSGTDVAVGSNPGSADPHVVTPPPPQPKPPDAAVAVVVTPPPPPEPTMVNVTVSSEPAGAEIFVDGIDVGKQTNTTLTVPIHGNAQIRLKLKGFDDFVLKQMQFDKDTTEPVVKLKKASSAVVNNGGHGPHAGSGAGSGKGSATPTNTGHNDTGLMNPDNM